MAILPGSSMRALRVGSGRGLTLRTAPRGARSGWMKHATGFTCPSRSDHQDRRVPEPLVASALSPDIPLELASKPPLKHGVAARILAGSGTKIGTSDEVASAYVSSGYSVLRWTGCGNLTVTRRLPYPRSSTKCGHVNPHFFRGYPADARGFAPRGVTLIPMMPRNPRSAFSYFRMADWTRIARSLP
jgi:hypothetical protein